MRNLKSLLLTAALAALAACSGGSDDSLTGPPGGGGPGGPPPEVATLALLTSSPQLPSDGTATATITALVRDANNNVMENVPVVFQASSGSLSVSQPAVTDANGTLTAVLSTAGNPANRTITVSGTAGDTQSSVSVNVIGSTLTLNCPPSLPLNDTGPCTVVLQNAAGTGIANTEVSVASATGNGLSATTLTTNSSGGASFNVTATASGIDTITVSGLGLEATAPVAVSADVFAFTEPAAGTEVPLGQAVQVTVNWQTGGVPVANGQQVMFSTTRGTLSASSAATAGGSATVTVSSTNAGPAVITATNAAGTSTQLAVEFVATAAATLELQAAPFTVPTNGQSALTAVVRDADGNLVKNKTVVFQLTDVTGGSLSVGQAITNSQGRAQSFYNASSTTSASNGVQITAQVQDAPGATDTVALTVAQRELFISIGTGNEIDEPNTAQYRKEWVVQVTDSQGVGVSGANLSLSVHSVRYWEGTRIYLDPVWVTRPGIEANPLEGCPDEDGNRNGILDPGEDQNGNGRIEAGNIATASAQGGGNMVTTNSSGFAIVDLFYPQEYAYWLEVTLEAQAAVQGTEYSARSTFVLPGSAQDFSNEDIAPPGVVSPFGTDGLCGTPPPPDGP